MDGFSKFGFITDTHFDYKYECRKDDTLATLLDKTRQCYEWFKKNGCEFVIHGGDVFDRHRIYNFDLLARVRNMFASSGLTTYFIIGQHDLSGYNTNTIAASNLGFIDAISDGAMKLIENEIEIGGYCFVASHVGIDPVETIKSINRHDMPVVAVCHALLTDQREAFGTISITHVKNPNVQLVLSGDLHEGIPFQSCNGIQFYNPGALARDCRGMRMPKVGMLQWNGNEFTLEEFYPKCPKCEDIFFWDDDKPAANFVDKNTVEENSKNFIESFTKFHSESKNIYELLEKIGKVKGVSNEILDLIKRHKDQKNRN